jgi:hypothetical protein
MTTTTSAPTRSERAKCWEARDRYFQCLDDEGVLAPSSEGKSSACFPLRKQFEKDCVKSWVSAKRRHFELFALGLVSHSLVIRESRSTILPKNESRMHGKSSSSSSNSEDSPVPMLTRHNHNQNRLPKTPEWSEKIKIHFLMVCLSPLYDSRRSTISDMKTDQQKLDMHINVTPLIFLTTKEAS